MKLRTNMEASKLSTLAKALDKAAAAAREDKIPPLDNDAEKELMKEVTEGFGHMLDSLGSEMLRIVSEEK